MAIKERHKPHTPKDQEKLEVLKRDGYACIICRTQEYLETAHVNHFAGEKPEGRRYYKLSSPDQQLVTLCRYHHAIYDGRLRLGLSLLLEASKSNTFEPQFRQKLLRLVEDRKPECMKARETVQIYTGALRFPNIGKTIFPWLE